MTRFLHALLSARSSSANASLCRRTVIDPSGGRVRNAIVTATQAETGFTEIYQNVMSADQGPGVGFQFLLGTEEPPKEK
jgi:hypothetical protein